MEHQVELDFRGKKLTIKTGKVAKQANGSVMVQYGNSVVFASAVMAKNAAEDPGFFPLSVHYTEKFYAAGKIPGGFLKRESKPSDKEVLTSRIIDRSLRPLFPEGFRNEVQVIPLTLATDQENPTDVLGVIAASAALMVSDIPFGGPVAVVRVILKNGEYLVNPTFAEIEGADLNILVSGTKQGITMIEGGASMVQESQMVEAIEKGFEVVQSILALQEEFQKKAGKTKVEVPLFNRPPEIDEEVRKSFEDSLKQALSVSGKKERTEAVEKVFLDADGFYKEKYDQEPANYRYAKEALKDLEYYLVREKLFSENLRVDGRQPQEIRNIDAEVDVLPMVHGSSLFTRGETQALGVLTLGSVSDEQRIDNIEGEGSRRYMLHYNFPPFSVGEAGRMGPPGRREVGHGYLAERSLEPVLPSSKEFPYTLRLVSEIMESNGSSSMATVCACCLAMMDGGVPIKAPVSGIAMGLMYNKAKDAYKILTDIQGLEDHYGDMDFKVAGTAEGITGFQLDIKLDAIPVSILKEALEEAKVARLFILEKMGKALKEPRPEISPNAPKLMVIQANPEYIRHLIGPGGKNIKKITEEAPGVKIDIADNGEITIFSPNLEQAEKVYAKVYGIVRDVKVGDEIEGPVKKIADFGAFIQVAEGREGMCHISNISHERIRKVSDVLSEGQVVKAKVINIDEGTGKIALSIKDLLK